jgi:hypothetical protein
MDRDAKNANNIAGSGATKENLDFSGTLPTKSYITPHLIFSQHPAKVVADL